MKKPNSGAELIAAERLRQIEVRGWTADHDDGHARGEMLAIAWPLWPISIAPGVILIVVGSMRSVSWCCGGCRERMDKDAEICPHCGSDVDWESIC